jgi:hypothetical protein
MRLANLITVHDTSDRFGMPLSTANTPEVRPREVSPTFPKMGFTESRGTSLPDARQRMGSAARLRAELSLIEERTMLALNSRRLCPPCGGGSWSSDGQSGLGKEDLR